MPLAVHVADVQAGQFADAQTRGVEQFQDGAVAFDEQARFIFGSAGARFSQRRRGLARRRELVEEHVQIFGGGNAGDAFRQFWRGDQPRGALLQQTFAHAKLEKRAERRQLARDRTFLKPAIVQVAEEFTDQAMIHVFERRRFGAGRSQVPEKLLEVDLVISQCARRGVAHGVQVREVLRDPVLDLASHGPFPGNSPGSRLVHSPAGILRPGDAFE